MPTPLSHIVYAAKLPVRFSNDEAPSFWVGAVFPDIRHTGVLKRTDTHHPVEKQSLASITDPFLLGTEFHNWLDIRREELAEQLGLYASNPSWPLKTATKFLEDELTCNDFSHWLELTELFESVRTIPHYPDLPAAAVHHWYSALADHMRAGASTNSAITLLRATTEAADVVQAVGQEMDRLRENPATMATLQRLVDTLSAECAAILVDSQTTR